MPRAGIVPLIAAVAASLLVPAGASAEPPRRVAVVEGARCTAQGCGNAVITGARYRHWYRIARRQGRGPGRRAQVVSFLVTGWWIEGEAARQGVRVTRSAVRRAFERDKRRGFSSEWESREFLRESGQTEADLLLRVRWDLLSERIRRRAVKPGNGDPDEEQRLLEAFVEDHNARWTEATRCARGYRVTECGGTLR